jgi:hypothetical protein
MALYFQPGGPGVHFITSRNGGEDVYVVEHPGPRSAYYDEALHGIPDDAGNSWVTVTTAVLGGMAAAGAATATSLKETRGVLSPSHMAAIASATMSHAHSAGGDVSSMEGEGGDSVTGGGAAAGSGVAVLRAVGSAAVLSAPASTALSRRAPSRSDSIASDVTLFAADSSQAVRRRMIVLAPSTVML